MSGVFFVLCSVCVCVFERLGKMEVTFERHSKCKFCCFEMAMFRFGGYSVHRLKSAINGGGSAAVYVLSLCWSFWKNNNKHSVEWDFRLGLCHCEMRCGRKVFNKIWDELIIYTIYTYISSLRLYSTFFLVDIVVGRVFPLGKKQYPFAFASVIIFWASDGGIYIQFDTMPDYHPNKNQYLLIGFPSAETDSISAQ